MTYHLKSQCLHCSNVCPSSTRSPNSNKSGSSSTIWVKSFQLYPSLCFLKYRHRLKIGGSKSHCPLERTLNISFGAEENFWNSIKLKSNVIVSNRNYNVCRKLVFNLPRGHKMWKLYHFCHFHESPCALGIHRRPKMSSPDNGAQLLQIE